MREILFRGKRIDTGEWVVGFFHIQRVRYARSKHWMSECCVITTGINEISGGYGERSETIEWEVDGDTIGQYTGLKDRNGNLIFEGDIVNTGLNVGVVRFRNGAFEVFRKVSGFAMYDMTGTDIEYEVIGNIHDNPNTYCSCGERKEE